MLRKTIRARAAAGLLTVVVGCATAPAPIDMPQQIEHVAVRSLDALPVPPPYDLHASVRAAGETDLQSLEELREISGRFMGVGLGVSGVGIAEVALTPGYFFAGSIVTGAIILAPMAVALDVTMRRQTETIAAVFQRVQLIPQIAAELDARVRGDALAPTRVDVDVVVLAYGLVPKSADAPFFVCLMVDADLLVAEDGVEVFRDTVFLEPLRRSADAPPPICAAIQDFAKDDGAALAAAIDEYARLVAAITTHRLGRLPWHG